VSVNERSHLQKHKTLVSMVRYSERKKQIRRLKKLIKPRISEWIIRDSLGFEWDDVEVVKTLGLIDLYHSVQSRRYLNRGKFKVKSRVFLHSAATGKMNDGVFLRNFRMEFEAFVGFVELIKNDPVFCTAEHTTKPTASVKVQLLCFLCMLGSEGNGSSSKRIGDLLGLSAGSVQMYIKNVAEALLSLEDSAVCWPCEEERKEIAASFQSKSGMPHNVGQIDGTHFSFAFAPRLADRECWYSRKARYGMMMLAVCDPKRRIRYFVLGWPSSVHDNRVWETCHMRNQPEHYFPPVSISLVTAHFQFRI